MTELTIRTVETRTHGRYLLRHGGREKLLVGFHGYGESVETHMAELGWIPGLDGWSVAAVQSLHRFYNAKTGEVVGSWMTKLDRDLMIDDNINYLRAVLADIPLADKLVFAGFSQGAAMAYRAAATFGAAGLIILAGDCPPELAADPTIQWPPILIGCGVRDDWFNEEKLKNDLSFLEPRTNVVICRFVGGHEWSDEFRAAAGGFLGTL